MHSAFQYGIDMRRGYSVPESFRNNIVSVVLDAHAFMTEDTVASTAVVQGGAVGSRGAYAPAKLLGLPVHCIKQLGLERLALLEQDYIGARLGGPLLGGLPRVGVSRVNCPVTVLFPFIIG